MTNSKKSTPAINSALTELRSRRLANAGDDWCDIFAKFSQTDQMLSDMDWAFADIDRRLTVLEKSGSALAHRPPQRVLTSWSPEGLAAALADMSPAELAKLRQ
jgi:hypothetical protein